MQLSPHFTLSQLTASGTAQDRGIDNVPPAGIIDNLRMLAAGLEQVQSLLGCPIEISSAYRSPELNRLVGGSMTSQHLQGLAADFVCPGYGTPIDVARAIRDSGICFDQCILEFSEWIHVSFSTAPRGRVLTIHDAKQGYVAGLWDREGHPVA